MPEEGTGNGLAGAVLPCGSPLALGAGAFTSGSARVLVASRSIGSRLPHAATARTSRQLKMGRRITAHQPLPPPSCCNAPSRDACAYPIVGMLNAFSPCGPPSGQRWVTTLFLVQNLRPSWPYWPMSPKPERFHPPKLWYETGTGMGTFTPTIPTLTRAVNSRAAWPFLVKI